MYERSLLPNLTRSRTFKNSITETLNFIKDSIKDLLTKRAIVYTIDNSAIARDFSHGLMIMDEDEIKKMQSKEEESEGKILRRTKITIKIFVPKDISRETSLCPSAF